MQINKITSVMPRALKMLPIAATIALSAITLKAKAQDDTSIKIESDSITAVAQGGMAVDKDKLTFEDPINDSIAAKIQQKKDTLYALGTDLSENVHLGFNVEGTGAEEIYNRVTSDISLSGTGNQFSGIYKALKDEQEALEAKGLSSFDVESQLDALKTLMNDYERDNNKIVREKNTETGVRSEFHYGENKSKVGYVTQTIGLKGNVGIKGKNSTDVTQLNDSTLQVNDSTIQQQTTNKKGEFNGGAIYGLEVETENSNVRFLGDFASDNTDLALSAETKKNCKTELYQLH